MAGLVIRADVVLECTVTQDIKIKSSAMTSSLHPHPVIKKSEHQLIACISPSIKITQCENITDPKNKVAVSVTDYFDSAEVSLSQYYVTRPGEVKKLDVGSLGHEKFPC